MRLKPKVVIENLNIHDCSNWMRIILDRINCDLIKADRGFKTSSQRVRVNTVLFAKFSKKYRELSKDAERSYDRSKRLKKGPVTFEGLPPFDVPVNEQFLFGFVNKK